MAYDNGLWLWPSPMSRDHDHALAMATAMAIVSWYLYTNLHHSSLDPLGAGCDVIQDLYDMYIPIYGEYIWPYMAKNMAKALAIYGPYMAMAMAMAVIRPEHAGRGRPPRKTTFIKNMF